MNTIVIDGLGLIGGSIALAIRKKWPEKRILAVDVNAGSLALAEERGIIHEGFDRLEDAAPLADVIILATPVATIIRHLIRLSSLELKPGVLVTDVGSTKKKIIEQASHLMKKGILFIGGHPMAGSHKTTLHAARADLFQSAYYFLISDTFVDERYYLAVKDLKDLLSGLDVKWQTVTGELHDQMMGQISHLPHIIASGLVNMSQDQFSHSPLSLRVAAGGFRSMTRIASSDPDMWTDILLSNREVLSGLLDQFISRMKWVKRAVTDADHDVIRNYFNQAKLTRDNLQAHTGKAAPNFYDLLINIPDQVGAIAKVTRILAEAQINLVNLHILEIREEIDGILQLTFASRKDLEQAASELSRHGLKQVEGDVS
ncbi:prephenate dehydrogenase [Sporolactobacillus sp. Y61]|uniref:Prephenate dehydrogenase n=1 Tax=Sporolactobacillus sp. Y61 TaxID=3160863 RepID=A0AAU8IHL0_9BACL